MTNAEIGGSGDNYLDQADLHTYDDGTTGPGGAPVARAGGAYGEDTYLENAEVYGDGAAHAENPAVYGDADEPQNYLEAPEVRDAIRKGMGLVHSRTAALSLSPLLISSLMYIVEGFIQF